MKTDKVFFNAHHAPMAAFASLTLGNPGASGGIGLEASRPADQNFFIGVETDEPGAYRALPFYNEPEDMQERFGLKPSQHPEATTGIGLFSEKEIRRDFRLTSDTWTAGPLRFSIHSPVTPLPDPAEETDIGRLRRAYLPAVLLRVTVDNSGGTRSKRAFLGFEEDDLKYDRIGLRRLEDAPADHPDAIPDLTGIAQGRSIALATRPNQPGVRTVIASALHAALDAQSEEESLFMLGGTGICVMETPPGETVTYEFALSFYREGIVTSGMSCRYFYTTLYSGLDDVARFALEQSDSLRREWDSYESLVPDTLSASRRFMLTSAIRSYYGSTELLEHDGELLYVVHEGEYRMMNTLDLMADMVFYELRMNPWVVANKLDAFAAYYSYHDRIRDRSGNTADGGLGFTHNMGYANAFSPRGRSCYEKPGLTGCFSHMTHEELVNWLLCALLHTKHTGSAPPETRLAYIRDGLVSLCRRDDPDPSKRDGVMDWDSTRTDPDGAEITTYDSLDPSLGQARNSQYLAGKSLAAYALLEDFFNAAGDPDRADTAGWQADLCAATLVASASPDGVLPAILKEGVATATVPVAEGAVYLQQAGRSDLLDENGRFGDLIRTWRRHLEAVLVPGICFFEQDGAVKLSASSDNSWLSKIYLNQFIAKEIFGIEIPGMERADLAHEAWLLEPENAYWCWSDQFMAGKVCGSRYYPRGVSAILWAGQTLEEM